MIAQFDRYTIKQVPREQNCNVDALTRLASARDAETVNVIPIEFLAVPRINFATGNHTLSDRALVTPPSATAPPVIVPSTSVPPVTAPSLTPPSATEPLEITPSVTALLVTPPRVTAPLVMPLVIGKLTTSNRALGDTSGEDHNT
ncbi:uncharacterized protein LOC133785570 [Humulus lupulus]|uniref:uncharacterized protein LOC133785570 n=1 Tax=Humulus lupulus TaxID=3486 RepID=UPI002B40A48F|nr:uncharacterized protein LOC133785570 [Humulus lupulus]